MATDPILTPVFRARWAQLDKPNDKDKYSVDMLFPKNADLKALQTIVREAVQAEWGDKFKPAQLVLPFKDGNDKINQETGEVYPEYADVKYATAATKYAPTVLDRLNGKKPIPTAQIGEKVYDGCYCMAQVSAYAWEYKDEKTKKVVKRGVSFQLENLLKYDDGERIGGGGKKHKAEDAFADIGSEGSSEDPGNYDSSSDWGDI